MALEVLKPGWLGTIQDLGRTGLQHIGIGPSGAMDWLSHRLANILVGNLGSAATLELTGPQGEFLARAPVLLASVGCSLLVEGAAIPSGKAVALNAGERVRLVATPGVFRTYLAVAGGFAGRLVHGTRSVQLGLQEAVPEFRAIAAGDVLGTAEPASDWASSWLAHLLSRKLRSPGWQVSPGLLGVSQVRSALVLPGDPDLLNALHGLCRAAYKVSPQSNRMGIRLQGPVLKAPSATTVSAGVCTGTIQLPPDGQPVVLMADRQTVGGYPVLGHVIPSSLPALAQLAPGEPIAFRETTLADAHAHLRGLIYQVERLATRVRSQRPGN